MFLEVWGDPWVSPARSESFYFVGLRWFSEIACFLMFCDRYLESTLFAKNKTTYSLYIDSGESKCY